MHLKLTVVFAGHDRPEIVGDCDLWCYVTCEQAFKIPCEELLQYTYYVRRRIFISPINLLVAVDINSMVTTSLILMLVLILSSTRTAKLLLQRSLPLLLQQLL
jgi:hypothetical protein